MTQDATSTHTHAPSDSDAQAQVISSLRSQIQDLYTQVTQLNSKLVSSYDRVSVLEDDLHIASQTSRQQTLKISQLEMERTQHLAALNTGLLVEKAQVTAELTRLMEKATEEAAQRGQAESARQAIEKELEDLSAGLFDQANRMVAEARLDKAIWEEKVHVAEEALRGAEEAVQGMQIQMQRVQEEREDEKKRMNEMEVRMGKGKWVQRQPEVHIRLLNVHSPFHEFLSFIQHLRLLHTSSSSPPAMATLLPLPFLTRLMAEDSDPTLRLDLAPSLNWLSRRSVLAAIHNGQLTIEPMATQESQACALCGASAIPSPQVYIFRITTPPTTTTSISIPKSLPMSISASSPLPLSYSPSTSTPTSTSTSTPTPHTKTHTPTPSASSTIYPLCSNGWCLARLRTTCSMWAFVRGSVVGGVWEEPVAVPPTPPAGAGEGEKPPVPTTPKKKSLGRGIWGMLGNVGERAASWGSTSGTTTPVPPQTPPPPPPPPIKSLPPPVHPSQIHQPRAVPPPLPKRNQSRDQGRSSLEHDHEVAETIFAMDKTPPPLPKRNEGRSRPLSVVMSSENKPAVDDSEVKVESPTPISPPAPAPAPPPIPKRNRPLSMGVSHAANIPLPESRPSTPTRTGSPVPVPGQTPPPLPRRALARGPRPMGPVERRTPTPTPEPTSTSMSDKVGDGEVQNTGTGTEKVEVDDTHKDTDESEKKEELDEMTHGAEKVEDAPTAVVVEDEGGDAQKEKENGVGVGAETTDKDKDALDVPVPDANTVAVAVAVEDTQTQTTDTPELNSPPPDSETKPKDTLVIDEPTKEAVVEKQEEEEETTPPQHLVTDNTWEEKTWKEIVRLKEEMFWARVGRV